MASKSASSPNHRLKQERLLHGWTQNDVAGHVGTDGYTVNRWERGRTVPSLYFRQKLCSLFDKSAEELGFMAQGAPVLLREGALPTIWHLPFRRNPFFTGRANILSQLHTYFQQDRESVWQPMIAICGLPGLGKTQVAIEYAYRFTSEYQAVFWVQADAPGLLLESFLALASVFDLPIQGAADQASMLAAIKEWLRTHINWLLIFDNVEEPESIHNFLPTFFTGHVLLTTRTQFMGTLAHCINIKILSPEEGALFLLRRTKLLHPREPLELAPEADSLHARALVRLMEGLPLALDQAATYIDETSCTISEYLQRYLTQSSHLLNIRGTFNEYHPMSVSASFALAIEKLTQMHPIAVSILQFCAFLFPTTIPEEFLAAHILLIKQEAQGELYQTLWENSSSMHVQAYGKNLLETNADNLTISSVMRELRRFSFIFRNAETKTVSMHRLVQEVVKERMDDTLQHFWAGQLVKVVNKVFPEVLFSTWQLCQRYLPHALTCATLIEHWNIVNLDAARLLERTGSYLLEQAHYQLLRALPMYKQESPEATATKLRRRHLLALYSYAYPDRQLNVANIVNDLSLLSHQQNNYILTEPILLLALSTYEQVVGPMHIELAGCLSTLASLYESQGKLEQAESLYTQALQIFETSHRENCICNILRSLAWLALAQGKYEQAENLYLRAFSVYEKIVGPDHPELAHYLDDYALALKKVEKLAAALKIEEQARTIRATFSEYDPGLHTA
jgi:transcriptional regulator with XRE-family HTH domain